MLSGEDEARLTFLAVRRWFGWSAGRLSVFDIGGGSLEIAGGADEAPDVAWSLPLGAARLARQHFAGRPCPTRTTVRVLRKQIRAEIARDAGRLLRAGAARPRGRDVQDVPLAGPDLRRRAVGRRPAGAALAAARRAGRVDPQAGRDDAATSWPACPASRRAAAHQIVPGALVAEAVMDIFELPALEICPWALREGVILERLDQIGGLA